MLQSNNQPQRGAGKPEPLIRELAPSSFVFEMQQALSSHACRDIVQRFESADDEQYPGRIGQMTKQDRMVKRSTDLVVSGKDHWKDVDRLLFHSLAVALRQVRKQFPYFEGPFKDMGYAVQRTLPGEYYHWHIDGGSHAFSQRQLVAIWYLNDVAGPGGETEFHFQKISVTPQEGKLILFPPFWTHEHRGVMLEAGVKYIATTWVVFA